MSNDADQEHEEDNTAHPSDDADLFPDDVEHALMSLFSELSENLEVRQTMMFPVYLRNLQDQCDTKKLQDILEIMPRRSFNRLSALATEAYGYAYHPRCPKPYVVIHDFPRHRQIRTLIPGDIGKLIKIPCIIVSAERIVTEPFGCMAKCEKCLSEFQINNQKTCPKCHSTKISIHDTNPDTLYKKTFTIQELNSDSRMMAVCFNEFVDNSWIGNCVYVTGILHSDSESPILNFKIEVLYIMEMPPKLPSSSMLTKRDTDTVMRISKMKNLFPTLVQSIAPENPTSSMLKAAILLSMFAAELPIHLLLITERSDKLRSIIQTISKLYPRCAIANELAPLPSKITKKGFEAGALVRANNGLLLIDGIDTLKKYQFSFIEAVESRSERLDAFRCAETAFSSITVGGIEASLLKAPLQEATGMTSPTLACFTLSCIADSESTNRSRALRALTPRGTPGQPFTFPHWDDTRLPLEKRFFLPEGLVSQHISEYDFIMYSAYARLFVKPVLSQGAEDAIEESVNELQKKKHLKRAEQSLRSLVLARAATDLRDIANEQDVAEMTELMWWFTEHTSSSNSQRNNSRKKIIYEFLQVFADASRSSFGRLGKAGLQAAFDTVNGDKKFACVEDLLDLLSAEGKILLCPNGDYRLGSG